MREHKHMEDLNSLQRDLEFLHRRLEILENKQCHAAVIKERISDIEVKLKSSVETTEKLTGIVENFILKMEETILNFTDKIYKDFTKFKFQIEQDNKKFIYWMVGTVLLSLISGLFIQYQAFRQVYQCLGEIRLEVTQEIFNRRVDSLQSEIKIHNGKLRSE